MSITKKNVKKNKKPFKMFALFVIYEVVIITITSPILLFHGPFTDVRNMVVGTAMKTFKCQYIATAFLSKDTINQILNENKSGQIFENEVQNEHDVNIEHRGDTGIERYDIPSTTKFSGYILEIKDPTRIKVGYTKNLGKVGEKTSEIATDHGAVAAINGGGFQDRTSSGRLWTGTGAYPEGIVISEGNSINKGIKPNERMSVAAFTSSGKLIVGEHSLNDLLAQNVTEALSSDPLLIINGKTVSVAPGLNPRTAIGQKIDGTIVMLVIDGRRGVQLGASLKEVQTILLQRGVYNASNLDGGSSSTMYFNGEIINNPL